MDEHPGIPVGSLEAAQLELKVRALQSYARSLESALEKRVEDTIRFARKVNLELELLESTVKRLRNNLEGSDGS